MTTKRLDYKIYMNDENWSLNDAINIVYSELEYKLKTNKTNNVDNIDFGDKKDGVVRILVKNISQYVDGEPRYYDLLDYDDTLLEENVLDKNKTRVNIKDFIKFVKLQNGSFPNELYEWYLQKSGCSKDIPVPTSKDSIKDQTDGLLDHEDIISDETILKLKKLTFPQMKQQVAMLAEQKKNWDASVMAAAKIGLLFYEKGLQKPTNEKIFVSEYKKHLDNFHGLQNETIKRIYKNLPEPYRHSRIGGKTASEQIDISTIIKSAVYAGSIFDTDDVKDLGKLKVELTDYLKERNCELPSDDVLEKIIEATKDI